MEKISSVERQLIILSLLSENKRGYSIGEILERLDNMGIEATRRMVSRDMDYISQNFFVYEQKREGKVVYVADKYALSEIDFSLSQIVSLYFTREMLKSYEQTKIVGGAIEMLDEILSKIAGTSRALLVNIENFIKIAPVKTVVDSTDEEILEKVRHAAQYKKRMEVTYRSFNRGETGKREFDPYVLEVREGNWHAIGFCHMRGAIRDLRVSRMIEVSVLDEPFEVPTGFYETYSRTRFDKLAGDEIFDVEIDFYDTAAKLVAEYHAGKADALEQRKDCLRFYKKTALTEDLTAWVLSFGSNAKVIKPDEFAEAVQSEAEKMVGIYGEGKK